MSLRKKATVYLEASLHRALRAKAGETDQSLSELVNAAIRRSLLEDAEDLSIIASRRREPILRFENVVKGLKRRGKL